MKLVGIKYRIKIEYSDIEFKFKFIVYCHGMEATWTQENLTVTEIYKLDLRNFCMFWPDNLKPYLIRNSKEFPDNYIEKREFNLIYWCENGKT